VGVLVPEASLFLRFLVLALFAAAFVAGCGAGGEQPSEEGRQGWAEESSATAGERVEIGGTKALVWGGGDYGVVMAHGASYDAASWEDQGQKIAGKGMVTLAPENTSPENLLASIRYMKRERGVRGVALIGGSAGGSAVLRAAKENPEAADQLIVLSASGDVSGLGPQPKLFIASEEEGGFAEEARRMAREAPGDQNEALILPGDAHAQAIFQTEEGDHLTQAILKRLEEYRLTRSAAQARTALGDNAALSRNGINIRLQRNVKVEQSSTLHPAHSQDI
jgi:pimeloyl-ACP methyl ester carboxylesterase